MNLSDVRNVVDSKDGADFYRRSRFFPGFALGGLGKGLAFFHVPCAQIEEAFTRRNCSTTEEEERFSSWVPVGNDGADYYLR